MNRHKLMPGGRKTGLHPKQKLENVDDYFHSDDEKTETPSQKQKYLKSMKEKKFPQATFETLKTSMALEDAGERKENETSNFVYRKSLSRLYDPTSDFEDREEAEQESLPEVSLFSPVKKSSSFRKSIIRKSLIGTESRKSLTESFNAVEKEPILETITEKSFTEPSHESNQLISNETIDQLNEALPKEETKQTNEILKEETNESMVLQKESSLNSTANESSIYHQKDFSLTKEQQPKLQETPRPSLKSKTETPLSERLNKTVEFEEQPSFMGGDGEGFVYSEDDENEPFEMMHEKDEMELEETEFRPSRVSEPEDDFDFQTKRISQPVEKIKSQPSKRKYRYSYVSATSSIFNAEEDSEDDDMDETFIDENDDYEDGEEDDELKGACDDPMMHLKDDKEMSYKTYTKGGLKIVEQDGHQVKRSTRVRYQPLEYWKNERVIYGRRKSGFCPVPVVQEVVRVPDQEPKKKKQKTKSDPEVTKVKFLDPFTNEEIEKDLVCPKQEPEFLPVEGADYLLAKYVSDPISNQLDSGLFLFPKDAKKPKREIGDRIMFCHILSGHVKVLIHKTELELKKGASFIVPKGNAYAIENIGQREAKIQFVYQKSV